MDSDSNGYLITINMCSGIPSRDSALLKNLKVDLDKMYSHRRRNNGYQPDLCDMIALVPESTREPS